MDESSPKPAAGSGSEKKSQQFDELSREELITKCRNLLTIAKKAKHSKDEATKEIERLKEEIEGLKQETGGSSEVTASSKNIEESLEKTALKDLQSQFNELSIENEALKRQIRRFADDNEDLLTKLQMLDEGSSEQQIEALNSKLLQAAKEYEDKIREMKSMQEDMIDKNSTKIKKLIQENSDLKDSLASRDDPRSEDQVKIKYDKCIRKLKQYREKIYDISAKFSEDREVLMTTTKEYSQFVTAWQKDIADASIKMIERINHLAEDLRKKNAEIELLKGELDGRNQNGNASEEKLLTEIQNLKELLRTTENSLNDEKEAHKKVKQFSKKPSVLDLEMQAYEKTLDEVNKKLEVKKLEVTEMEKSIQMKNETMESLRSQISLLEANLESEKVHSSKVKKDLDSQLDLLRKTEHERTEVNLQLELLSKNFEALKLETSESKLEMAEHVAEVEKRYKKIELERDELSKTIFALENDLDKLKKLSLGYENEIATLRTEFSSYKVRAQSVLRQSQTKDLSKEQELQEQVFALQEDIEGHKTAKGDLTNELEALKNNYKEAVDDKSRLQSRCKSLLEALEKQSHEVLEEANKRSQQHEESIKEYQLQIDTLNTFYKKKIQENEETSTKTIADLKAQIAKTELAAKIASNRSIISNENPTNIFTMKHDEETMNVLMHDREEAEGSEDQSSQSSAVQNHPRRKISRGRELVPLKPLDELLNSSFDDNLNEMNDDNFSTVSAPSVDVIKSKLDKEENRNAHLMALLNDSEKDVARLQQLNDLLKEEVRRQQRNSDREEHTKNNEYLKNIVVKFVTLNNGDEKQRLIPVLNTILRLSADENTMLQNACKGGWTGLWTK